MRCGDAMQGQFSNKLSSQNLIGFIFNVNNTLFIGKRFLLNSAFDYSIQSMPSFNPKLSVRMCTRKCANVFLNQMGHTLMIWFDTRAHTFILTHTITSQTFSFIQKFHRREEKYIHDYEIHGENVQSALIQARTINLYRHTSRVIYSRYCWQLVIKTTCLKIIINTFINEFVSVNKPTIKLG